VSTSTILYRLNIADDGCAERMRLICSFRRKEMKMEKASFLKRVAPRPNNALKAAAYSGLWFMQIQGPKTIGHMNTYISMLDFTSVPAWIILYCFTAGGCFNCLSCKFFLVVFSTGFFQDPGMDLSVFTHAAPLAG
jgi:hypothetical protein